MKNSDANQLLCKINAKLIHHLVDMNSPITFINGVAPVERHSTPPGREWDVRTHDTNLVLRDEPSNDFFYSECSLPNVYILLFCVCQIHV